MGSWASFVREPQPDSVVRPPSEWREKTAQTQMGRSGRNLKYDKTDSFRVDSCSYISEKMNCVHVKVSISYLGHIWWKHKMRFHWRLLFVCKDSGPAFWWRAERWHVAHPDWSAPPGCSPTVHRSESQTKPRPHGAHESRQLLSASALTYCSL